MSVEIYTVGVILTWFFAIIYFVKKENADETGGYMVAAMFGLILGFLWPITLLSSAAIWVARKI